MGEYRESERNPTSHTFCPCGSLLLPRARSHRAGLRSAALPRGRAAPAPRPLPHHVKYLGRGGGVCVMGLASFPLSLPPPPPFLWKRQAVRLHAPHGVTALSPRARWTPLVREWLSEMRTYSPPPRPPPSPAMRLLANGPTRIISSDLFSHRTPQEDSVFLTKAKMNVFFSGRRHTPPPFFM